VGNAWSNGIADPFRINSGLPEGGKIPEEYVKLEFPTSRYLHS
jgi:hypothetical protein